MFKSMGYDENEMEKALYVYGAMARLVEKYNLCGVTIRCFDLLDTVFTTGCIGLSILNNMGIYGGCEGDVPVLLSMAVMGAVTGEDMFLCNANKFDTREGTALFAHCTIPTTMLKSFELNTHFESDIGVAVQGTFDETDCTIFKCEGDLSRFHAQEGVLKPVPFSNMLCRTQCKVELDDFSYFLTKPINNHHLICRGKHKAELEAFFRLIEN
jgi:L-fucose isomerase-like protein